VRRAEHLEQFGRVQRDVKRFVARNWGRILAPVAVKSTLATALATVDALGAAASSNLGILGRGATLAGAAPAGRLPLLGAGVSGWAAVEEPSGSSSSMGGGLPSSSGHLASWVASNASMRSCSSMDASSRSARNSAEPAEIFGSYRRFLKVSRKRR
jgi:hypothetical protein